MAGSQFRGRSVDQWGDEVKRLKREKNYAELIPMLQGMVEVLEAEAAREKWSPGPGYYGELALAYRRVGDLDAEIAILERYNAIDKKYGGAGAIYEADLRKAHAAKAKATVVDLPPACPDCGSVIPDEFVKSAPCPDCSTRLTIKIVDGRKVIVSKDSAAAAKMAKDEGKRHEKFLRLASQLDCPETQFEQVRSNVEKSWGSRPSDADVFWHIANQVAVAAAEKGEWGKCSRAYHLMADQLVERGQPWLEVQRQSVLAQVRLYTVHSPNSLVLITRGCKCEECMRQQQQTLGEALEKPVLPHANCQSPPCSCVYVLPPPDFASPPGPRAQVKQVPEAKKGFLARLMGGK